MHHNSNTNKMNLINKIKENIGHIKMSDNNQRFYIDGSIEMSLSNDQDGVIVIEKLNNLIVLMNNELNNGDIDTFLDKDFETEIYNLI